MVEAQAKVGRRNAAFWNEICGTWLAQQLGITEPSQENLDRYDEAYLNIYPYLTGYLPEAAGEGERLLEIGLGYGTVAQVLATRGFEYHGLDIAPRASRDGPLPAAGTGRRRARSACEGRLGPRDGPPG